MKRTAISKLIASASLVLSLSAFTIDAYAQPMNKSFNYSIKKGDTIEILALRFNSSRDKIMALNPGLVPTNLGIGSKMKIAAGDGIMIHFIKPGDSLWKISQKHHSTIKILADKNFIANPDLIYSGDILSVPMEHHGKMPMKHDSKIPMENHDKKPMEQHDKTHMKQDDTKSMEQPDKKPM
jgi:LysM repeat protein